MNNRDLNKKKILAIIPARGGSKGIPGKNIKKLAGQPLISYTINSAKQSKCINKFIVSSDSPEIISICKTLGVEAPFKRPSELAEDNTGSLEVVKHALDFYEKREQYFDAVLLLQPTTPFREKGFIDKAIKAFFNNQCDSLVSVLPVPHKYNPHWVYEPNEKGYLKISTGETKIVKQRQELPKAFFRDGSIYLTKTEIIKQGSLYGDKISYLESNPEFYVNIDTSQDWEEAKRVLKQMGDF